MSYCVSCWGVTVHLILDEVKSSVFLPLLLSAGKCAKCPIYLTFCDGNFAPLVFEELSHSEGK